MMGWFRKCVAGAVVVCCASCGGGGGGAASTPERTTSGLLPAAGTPGDVLYQQAADIRPVLAGAQWVYHSNDYATRMEGQFTTTAAPAAGGGLTEVDSDSPEIVTTVTVDANGNIAVSADLSIAAGAPPIRVSGFELRSPVRVNDQYVLLDRHVVDSGIDVDGDGKSDAMDIAMWRVVQGRELVSLPQVSTQLSAVRVDTYLAASFTPSKGGAVVSSSTREATWYAAGLGVVRAATYSTTAGRTYDSESWLTGFNGVSRGWGVVVQPPQYASFLAPTGSAYQAIQTADGALVLTPSYMLKVSKDGRVVSATASSVGAIGGALYGTSGGLRHVASSDQRDIRISAVNDDGSLSATLPVVHINLDNFNSANDWTSLSAMTIASGGDRFWMCWQRHTTSLGNPAHELLAQAFGLDGNPVGSVVAMPSQGLLGSTVIARATSDNGLIVTWDEWGSNYAMAQARIDRNGALVWSSRQDTNGSPGPSALFPLLDESTTWLTWRAATLAGADDRAHGVRLDATGQFSGVATTGAAFASEALPAVDAAFFTGWSNRYVASGGHFLAVATVFGPRYPDVDRSENHLEYAEFDAGTGRLAAGLTQIRRITLDGLAGAPLLAPMVFDDRVLVLSDDGSTLRPAVIWR